MACAEWWPLSQRLGRSRAEARPSAQRRAFPFRTGPPVLHLTILSPLSRPGQSAQVSGQFLYIRVSDGSAHCGKAFLPFRRLFLRHPDGLAPQPTRPHHVLIRDVGRRAITRYLRDGGPGCDRAKIATITDVRKLKGFIHSAWTPSACTT